MKLLLSAPVFSSRIHGDEVGKSEKILGYFLGPCLVYTVNTALSGTYLTQFYTDVLGLAGAFLTWMPFASKLFAGVTALFLGQVIDRTRSAQGKARPWILLSGVLLTVCGLLLYTVPRASYRVQIAWVVVSYNLFFALAYNFYTLSHTLMVPLSTSDGKQRDSLAMLTSMATSMLPGVMTTIVMPLLVRFMGVGEGAQSGWLRVMSIISIFAIPATMLEYYFTRERVSSGERAAQTASLRQQIRACLTNRFWILIMIYSFLSYISGNLTSSVMLYYCNWVLGNSVASGAAKQILVNVVGQAPMGYGIFLLWPMVKKYGKRPITVIGYFVAAAGSIGVYFAGSSMPFVLGALFIKSIGSLPGYLTVSYLAEALDSVAEESGFRADGFSASVNSLVQAAALGLSQTILLGGISRFGYIAPASSSEVIVQSTAVVNFFRFCFAGVPVIGYALCAVIILLCKKKKAENTPV